MPQITVERLMVHVAIVEVQGPQVSAESCIGDTMKYLYYRLSSSTIGLFTSVLHQAISQPQGGPGEGSSGASTTRRAATARHRPEGRRSKTESKVVPGRASLPGEPVCNTGIRAMASQKQGSLSITELTSHRHSDTVKHRNKASQAYFGQGQLNGPRASYTEFGE